jgi:uncharacterized membrane protein
MDLSATWDHVCDTPDHVNLVYYRDNTPRGDKSQRGNMNLPTLIVHIASGGVALPAGAAALWFRKGGGPHAKVGTVFFGAMLVLTVTGWAIASLKPDWGTAVIAILTAYLVATSWVTARRRDGKAGPFELFGFAVATACAVTFLGLGFFGVHQPNSLPPAVNFPFAALAVLAAALDLNFILRRGVSPAQRIARHLWRMCTALLIAAFSFFLGQQKVMPTSWQGSPFLFVPPLTVLALMVFWLLRVRFSSAFKRHLASRGSQPGPIVTQDRAEANA